MNLDEILALAAQDEPTSMERARARRAVRKLQREYARRVAEGPPITCDIELSDPFTTTIDEVTRITRAAQLAKLGTITWDSRRRQLSWSDEMSMIFGYPPGLARQSLTALFALIHPDDRRQVRRTAEAAWRDKTVSELTYRVIRADATTAYVHCYIEVLTDEDDRPYGIIGTGQDVTDLELARQERDRLARRCQSVRMDLLDRDPVTGLLTRARFADEIDRAQRAGTGTLLVIAAPPAARTHPADQAADAEAAGNGRPGGDRFDGDRPSGNRPDGDRPSGDRPDGDRPDGDRFDGDQFGGDRPDGNRFDGNRFDGAGPAGTRPGDRSPADTPTGDHDPVGTRPGDHSPADTPTGAGLPGGTRPGGTRSGGDRLDADRQGDALYGDDQLAAATAEVLKKLARPADACGLVGRHEFGVLMQYTTIETAVPIAEEILDGLTGPSFMAAPDGLRAYGGLVRYDHRAPTGSLDLLIDAEAAWRRAKRYRQPLHVLRQTPSVQERQETCRARVRAAVAGNRFTLYAQPLRDLALNRITRHEILLRVLDDTGHALPPATFLDIAERVDEILPVDKWVIDQAMRLIGRGSQTSHYQINISGRSLADPYLLDHVRLAIRRHGVNAECLTFEITETALIGNLTEARRFADGVRELGCQLALDDFGAGYTSFTYLKYFPIDLVKIDGDFIHDLPNSPTDQAIVRSLVQVCHALGVRTAAEYVQDRATVDLLREYGVDFAQGYHIGKPEPVATGSHAGRPITLDVDPAGPAARTALG